VVLRWLVGICLFTVDHYAEAKVVKHPHQVQWNPFLRNQKTRYYPLGYLTFSNSPLGAGGEDRFLVIRKFLAESQCRRGECGTVCSCLFMLFSPLGF